MSSENSLENLIFSDDSKSKFSKCFIFQVIFPIIGGFMFGYDTGVVSGALLLLRNYFNLSTFSQEIVVSATIFAAAISSLVAGILSNIFGRKKVILFSCICFMIGPLLMSLSVNIYMLIVGRIVVGFGVGMSATCCPVFISEISPESIRGRLIMLYQTSITAGMFVSALVDASFNYIGQEGWRFMLGAAVIPGLIEFVGMLSVSESYRWLLSKNRIEDAKKVIRKLDQIPEDMIDKYVTDIVDSNKNIERIYTPKSQNLLFQIFRNKVARRSLLIGCGLQMLAQIIGINTIMYYTASVIRMSGVQDISTILWLSALVSFFNFMPSIVGYILIDKIGRRKLAMVSLIGVLISLILLAITFQVFNSQSALVDYVDPLSTGANDIYCREKKNCEDCITSSKCGFCYITSSDKQLISNSSCLAAPYNFADFSSSGWCSKNSSQLNNQAKWLYDYCISKYSWIIVLELIIYLICFTVGMGPVPWAITSEIYPIWCRSANMAMSTATNWTFNLIISLTFLSLTEAITKYGTFWLYSSFAICGLVFIYKYLPETNQRTLEEISQLIDES